MKRLVTPILSLMVAFSATTSFNAKAESTDPKPHMEQITAQISTEILANKDKIKADSSYAKSLIEDYLLPEVDTTYMSKRILGKKYWTEATEAQRSTFTNEFVGLLLNSYAKGLASYDGQPITYEDTQFSKSGKTANVRSKIQPAEGEAILIDYRLKVQPDQSWLITDVIIEGVSMAKSYANQYREKIKAVGLEATLNELATENSKAKEITKITDS